MWAHHVCQSKSFKRDPEVGQGVELFSDMGFQHPLQDRRLDRHGLPGCSLHICGQLRGHEGRHARRPGNPDIALLPGEVSTAE